MTSAEQPQMLQNALIKYHFDLAKLHMEALASLL